MKTSGTAWVGDILSARTEDVCSSGSNGVMGCRYECSLTVETSVVLWEIKAVGACCSTLKIPEAATAPTPDDFTHGMLQSKK